MTQAKSGDTVRIHYTGRLANGTQFDSSDGGDPLQFQLGSGQIISGLDRQIEGMEVGARSTLTVPAAEAYGAHNPNQVQQVPRNAFPAGMELEPGAQLQASTPDGTPLRLTVLEAAEDQVTVDANHPLAGQDLVFEVELVEIVRAA